MENNTIQQSGDQTQESMGQNQECVNQIQDLTEMSENPNAVAQTFTDETQQPTDRQNFFTQNFPSKCVPYVKTHNRHKNSHSHNVISDGSMCPTGALAPLSPTISSEATQEDEESTYMYPPERTLFVGNLLPHVDEHRIRREIGEWVGKTVCVEHIDIPKDYDNGESLGHAYVIFVNAKDGK